MEIIKFETVYWYNENDEYVLHFCETIKVLDYDVWKDSFNTFIELRNIIKNGDIIISFYWGSI